MRAFAYGDGDGHGATVRREHSILSEQLNARLRVLGIGGTWSPETMHPARLKELTGTLNGRRSNSDS